MLGCLAALDAELRARGARLVRPARAPARPRCAGWRRGRRGHRARLRRRLGLGARPRRARGRRRSGATASSVRHPGPSSPTRRRSGRGRRALHGLLPLPPRLAARGAPRPSSAPPGELAHGAPGRGRPAGLRALGFDGRPPRPRPPVPSPARPPPAARRASWSSGPAWRGTRERRDELAGPTSRLSAYLRFGCLSPLELERARRQPGGGARYRDQLAWRDFYARGARALPADRARRVPGALPRPRVGRRRRRSRRGARAAPASRSSTPPCASSPRRLDAQPRAHGRRLVPDEGPPAGLARGRA